MNKASIVVLNINFIINWFTLEVHTTHCLQLKNALIYSLPRAHLSP